jgi:hypothetical protein
MHILKKLCDFAHSFVLTSIYCKHCRVHTLKHLHCTYGKQKFDTITTLPPTVSRLSRQCGIPNISQPYRPRRPVTGIALPFVLL